MILKRSAGFLVMSVSRKLSMLLLGFHFCYAIGTARLTCLDWPNKC